MGKFDDIDLSVRRIVLCPHCGEKLVRLDNRTWICRDGDLTKSHSLRLEVNEEV